MLLLGITIGCLLGIVVTCFGVSRLIAGDLIVVNQPDEQSYIFAELNPDGFNKISKKKCVVMKIQRQIDMSHD